MTISSRIEHANCLIINDNVLLRLIKSYSPLEGEELDENSLTKLKKNALYIGVFNFKHDDSVKEYANALTRISKKQLAKAFLKSFETGNPELRGGLVSYAILKQIPVHEFENTAANNCKICISEKESSYDLTFLNSIRLDTGLLCNTDVTEQCFNMLMAEKTLSNTNIESTGAVFNSIIKGICESRQVLNPQGLVPIIRKILPYKHSTEQIRSIIDMLGVLSILETPEHKGFMNHYTNLGTVKKKSRSSDWAYPVDWWTGAHGVNMDAVDYWFGDILK